MKMRIIPRRDVSRNSTRKRKFWNSVQVKMGVCSWTSSHPRASMPMRGLATGTGAGSLDVDMSLSPTLVDAPTRGPRLMTGARTKLSRVSSTVTLGSWHALARKSLARPNTYFRIAASDGSFVSHSTAEAWVTRYLHLYCRCGSHTAYRYSALLSGWGLVACSRK